MCSKCECVILYILLLLQLYSRYSFLAQYTIIELATGNQIQLTAQNEKILRLAVWGPVGNSLIYIHNNNIFFRPSVTIAAEIQLTGDGELGIIYNGVPDWVYEGRFLSCLCNDDDIYCAIILCRGSTRI